MIYDNFAFITQAEKASIMEDKDLKRDPVEETAAV